MESATSNDPPVGSEGTCREYISSWDALDLKSAAEEVGGRMVRPPGHSSKPAGSHYSLSLARSLQLFVIAAPSPRIPYLSVLLLAPYPCGSYLPNHLSLFLGLFIPCHDSASSNTTCVFLLLVWSLWVCGSVAVGLWLWLCAVFERGGGCGGSEDPALRIFRI